MRFYRILSQLPENAVFWLLLFSLAIGSATSLYGKITDKSAAMAVHAEHYVAVPASAGPSVISMKDYISSELPYPCQIYRMPSAIR